MQSFPTNRWEKLARRIEALTEGLGRGVMWLSLAVVLIGSWNALARYGTRFTGWNLSSNAYLELQWYLFSVMFLLGASVTLRDDSHVRVDVLYHRISPKARAWINVAGTVLFLIPFCLLMIWASWFPVRNSWAVHEMSPDPGGLARYPIKTLIPVAFFLLLLQGVAYLIREVAVLRSSTPEVRPPEDHL